MNKEEIKQEAEKLWNFNNAHNVMTIQKGCIAVGSAKKIFNKLLEMFELQEKELEKEKQDIIKMYGEACIGEDELRKQIKVLEIQKQEIIKKEGYPASDVIAVLTKDIKQEFEDMLDDKLCLLRQHEDLDSVKVCIKEIENLKQAFKSNNPQKSLSGEKLVEGDNPTQMKETPNKVSADNTSPAHSVDTQSSPITKQKEKKHG